MVMTLVEINELLNETDRELTSATGDASKIIRSLASNLRVIKKTHSPEDWDAVISSARSHSLRESVHQDPLSYRAFSTPRGYQGDAELLDLIYTKDISKFCPQGVSKLGCDIFSYTIECDAPEAVRERRRILTRTIDSVAEEFRRPHVLSVACGHLREAQDSTAVRSGKIGRFVGLDQDPESLRVISAEQSSSGIETINGSIKLLLGGSLTKQRFDLIYAAGLYDYLEDSLAKRLTERMFSMLNTGGLLLLANYAHDIQDVGYMETYMGWRLIYRSETQFETLAERLRNDSVLSRRLYLGENKNICYMEIKKK